MDEIEQKRAIVEITEVLDKWLEKTDISPGYWYDGETHDMATAAVQVLINSSRGQNYLRRQEIDS